MAVASRATTDAHAPSIAVVVCAYTLDRWEELGEAIGSVMSQSRPADEIVLVVDHNEELENRAAATFSTVAVVPNTLRRGLSGARNAGIAASTADIIAFIDDDAVAEGDWLKFLTEPFNDDDVMAAGGAVVPLWAQQPAWLPEEFFWVVGCSYRGLPTEPAEIRNPIGASMAVRRRVFADVGGFSDGLGRIGRHPLGCEETELCIRAARHAPNSRSVYEPRAIVHHRVPASRSSWQYFLRRCYAEGLSKAVVTRMVGTERGLSTERSYVRQTLPTGAFRSARRAVAERNSAAASRALAIPAGLAATSAGFVAGRLAGPASWTAPVSPVFAGQFELSSPVWPPPRMASNGRLYGSGRLLVRQDDVPVGVLELSGPAWPSVDAIRARIATEFRSAGAPTVRPSASGPVSVVIPTRDRPDALDRCLASVANLDYPPFEVLVVDNASSSGRTREVVEAWSDRHPSIFYLREDRPGSSRARNAGIWQARTPIVAFTDDDVEVDRHWLRHIAAAFSQEGVVCATGLVWPASLDSAAEQWFEEYGGFGKGCEPRLWDLDQHRGAGPLYPYTVGAYGSGNNVAFSTDFLLRVGGYDSALGPGTAARAGEDLDLFLRAILSGHRIAYSPSAIVVHHHRTDPRALRAQLAAYGIGISAVLSKWAMRDPSDVLRRIPEGTRTLVSRSSDKNAGKKPTYPGRLQLAEWGGMVRGPAAYWRSSRRRADTGPRLTIAALPE